LGSFREQEKQCCNGKQNGGEPIRETPKVARYSIVADEAVVANISERVRVMTSRAKGFT